MLHAAVAEELRTAEDRAGASNDLSSLDSKKGLLLPCRRRGRGVGVLDLELAQPVGAWVPSNPALARARRVDLMHARPPAPRRNDARRRSSSLSP